MFTNTSQYDLIHFKNNRHAAKKFKTYYIKDFCPIDIVILLCNSTLVMDVIHFMLNLGLIFEVYNARVQ